MVVLARGQVGPERVPGPGLHGQGSKKFLQIDMVLVWLCLLVAGPSWARSRRHRY